MKIVFRISRAAMVIAIATLAVPAVAQTRDQAWLDQRAEAFVFEMGAAVVISAVCGKREGMYLKARDARELIAPFKSEMKQEGFRNREIKTAIKKAQNENVQRQITGYLRKRGMKDGDEAALCAIGRSEVKSGSAIGKYLKDPKS